MQTLFYVPMVSEELLERPVRRTSRRFFADTWDSLVDEQRAEAQRRQSEAADINEENGIVAVPGPSPEEKQRAGELLAPTVDGLVEELDIDPGSGGRGPGRGRRIAIRSRSVGRSGMPRILRVGGGRRGPRRSSPPSA